MIDGYKWKQEIAFAVRRLWKIEIISDCSADLRYNRPFRWAVCPRRIADPRSDGSSGPFRCADIAEGSIDAATSVKLELNLYNVARASLEELRLDYQDYLRQHNFPIWTKDSILYQNFIGLRISDKAGFKAFIRQAESSGDQVNLQGNLYKSFLVANAVLLLISSASYFLKRQIDSKSIKFLENGGFSERMSQLRKNNRKTWSPWSVLFV